MPDTRGWFPAASCVRPWGQGETCCSASTPGPWSDKFLPSSPLGLASLPCLLDEGTAQHSLPGPLLPVLLLPLSLPGAGESSQPALDPPLHPWGWQVAVYPHRVLPSHYVCFLPLPRATLTSYRLISWLSPSEAFF